MRSSYLALSLLVCAAALPVACGSSDTPYTDAPTTGSSSGATSSGLFTTGAGSEDGACGVDILFVVDNSGSMQEHAPATIAAFNTFVNEMISAVPMDTSLHVGLTRATGFYDPGNGAGWGAPSCEAALTDGVWSPPDKKNNMTPGQQGRLFEQAGMRFFDTLTGADPAPLKTWFEAAMKGAIDGSAMHSNTETPVAAAAYPFHPANAMYNSGFLRDKAVLLIFLLSDSPDLSPPMIPTTDFIKIVHDAKAGCSDKCVIVTGAIAGACYGKPGNTNKRLYDFMNGFGHPPPSWVNLQAGSDPDYTGVLGKALAGVIVTTCQEITNPK